MSLEMRPVSQADVWIGESQPPPPTPNSFSQSHSLELEASPLHPAVIKLNLGMRTGLLSMTGTRGKLSAKILSHFSVSE